MCFRSIGHDLRRRCKHTSWPFTREELQLTSHTWTTGPDGTSHEAPKALLADPASGGRLVYLLNDMFYTARIPDSIDRTRPITLSSTRLKWTSQLLMARAGHRVRHAMGPTGSPAQPHPS